MQATTALVPILHATANGHSAGGALVINLSDRPDVLDVLYKEALRRQIPVGALVAEMLANASAHLVKSATPPTADPDGRAAYASGRGLEVPVPEGKN